MTTRDVDPNIDLFINPLFKKSTDTNQFISEASDKALTSLVISASDNKIFHAIQGVNSRSAGVKIKQGMCYNTLIDKLGAKVRNFREIDKLV